MKSLYTRYLGGRFVCPKSGTYLLYTYSPCLVKSGLEAHFLYKAVVPGFSSFSGGEKSVSTGIGKKFKQSPSQVPASLHCMKIST